ncbi:MAG: cytochrome-c oxidase, cbb3-type subunit III [Alphaproteobacteria bacterium]|nr:cytochrome-c oxidase, cbb3-type subunit III [Alphaproteobacteria bacterium]
MNDHHDKDIDELSGIETTGHEWDGLKELNNPLPRWWVWVFVVTCLWSFWYFVVYPAWPVPGGATTGTSGYTQFKELEASQSEISARQQVYLDRFQKAEFQEIMNDPELYVFAKAGGSSAFKDNCATCHGSGAEGGKGYPNLNDDDWLWGGRVEDIYTTLLHGIRVHNDMDTRQSQMPAFGRDGLLKRDEINQLVTYVMDLSKGQDVQAQPGHVLFQQNCASCHGADGKGNKTLGAPNLTDAIWLYGGTKADIYYSIFNARGGVMPAWKDRLDEQTIRQLSIYVHELGGGEETMRESDPAAVPMTPPPAVSGAADDQ